LLHRLFFFSFISMVLLIIAIPILYLGYEGSLGRFSNPSIMFSMTLLESILLTMISSAIATTISLVLGAPVAYYLARYSFRGKGVVEVLIDLPTSVPHPMIGISILLIAGPIGPLAPILRYVGVDNITYSFLALVLALIIVSMPIMIKSLANSFRSMDIEPEIAAITLGVNRVRVFLEIVLPMSIRSIMNSYAITLARSISEFGAIGIVAYYVLTPPFQGVKPASVIIWDLFESMGIAPAVSASAALLLLSFIVLVGIRISEKRS